MMTTTKVSNLDKSALFNRILYSGFLLMGVYFLATNDISNALSNLGIGLVFDPFDQKVSWKQRPHYQKIVLLVQLSVVFVLLGILIANRFG